MCFLAASLPFILIAIAFQCSSGVVRFDMCEFALFILVAGAVLLEICLLVQLAVLSMVMCSWKIPGNLVELGAPLG